LSFLRLAALADRHRDEAPSGASIQGDCSRQRKQSKPRQRAPRGRAAEPVGVSRPQSVTVGRAGASSEVPRSQVTATPMRWRAVGLVSTAAKRNARMPQGTRAAEVDALVSTPLRPELSGPGIRTSAERMRPSFGKGPRPRMRRPPAGGSGALLPSPHGDIGLHSGQNALAGGGDGFIAGAALNKCAWSGQSATTGNDLIYLGTLPAGMVSLGTAPVAAADGALCGALEGLLPPGFEVSPAVGHWRRQRRQWDLFGGPGSAATRWSNRGNGGSGALTEVIAMLSTTGGEPPLRTRERAKPDQFHSMA